MDFDLSQSNTVVTTDTIEIDFDISDSDLFGLTGDDDPPFEVEESVQCTRGSSPQSLSSLLPVSFNTHEVMMASETLVCKAYGLLFLFLR